jgi:hypothetical protein
MAIPFRYFGQSLQCELSQGEYGLFREILDNAGETHPPLSVTNSQEASIDSGFLGSAYLICATCNGINIIII